MLCKSSIFACRSAMDTTNSNIRELEIINGKILELAKFVLCQLCYHIKTCLNRNRTPPQLVQSKDNNGRYLAR